MSRLPKILSPEVLAAGLENGAARGICFKDAESLKLAARVSTIVMDKTGTLLEGKPSVVESVWDPSLALETGSDARDFRDVLFSLERQSDHPLADSVCASLRGCTQLPVADFQAVLGKGISGTVEGTRYYVGNLDLLESVISADTGKAVLEASSTLLVDSLRLWMDEGYMITLLFDTNKVYAVLALADNLRESAVQAVRVLQDQGLEVHMLTGENEVSARRTASETGIRHVHAHVLPEDQARYVADLQAAGKTVAMVGDLVNNGAALEQADLGIVLDGSAASLDGAQVTLSSQDLGDIWQLICLARRTLAIVRENLFLAGFFLLAAVLIVLVLLFPIPGWRPAPMLAVCMVLSGICVVTNSLRLRK